jgi:hypothetical protein
MTRCAHYVMCLGNFAQNTGNLLTAEGACEYSTTGWVFTCVLLAASLVYVVLGTAYNVRAKGLPLSVEALPHRAFWAEIRGLCGDGAALVVAAARGDRARSDHADGSAAVYTAVPDAAGAGAGGARGVARLSAAATVSQQDQQAQKTVAQSTLLEASSAPRSGTSSSSSSSSSDDGRDHAWTI